MPDHTGPLAERHLEIESKLDAAPGFVLPALAADPSLRALGVSSMGEAVEHRLDALYYDTAGLDLLRSKLTLRRRTGGTDAGWHLKLPAGPAARTEVRLPEAAGTLDGDDVPASLAGLVLGAARGRPLLPVARLGTLRRARHLLDAAGRPLAEIAEDAVTGTDLRDDGSRETRWQELEVELEDGPPELLSAIVAALLAAGTRPAGWPSKLGRLLPTGGAGAEAVTGSSARPGRGADALPGAEPSAGRLLIGYLARQRDLLVDADIRLRAADPDAEAPHDARAAARRIRSVLRVFGPVVAGPMADAIAARLRWFGRAASQVRDVDVVLARLDRPVPVDGPHTDGAPDDGWRRTLADRRTARLDTLCDVLRSDEYLGLLSDLDDFVAEPPRGGVALAAPDAVLAPLVAAAWLRLRSDADLALPAPTGHHAPDDAGDATAPSTDDRDRSMADPAPLLHRVRKDAKTVRYAADAAADAGGAFGTAMAGFAARVEQIQDLLGERQDAVTTLGIIDWLPGAADITDDEGSLLRTWARSERATAQRAAVEFAALRPSLPLLPTS